MDLEEIRPFVIEFLKQRSQTQVIDVVRGVEDKLTERGLYQNQTGWMSGTTGTHQAPEEDLEKIREIINEFIVQGILMWGLNLENASPPFLRVTTYGAQVLASGEPTPHDPDGYLSSLKSKIPNLDETILIYVSEALEGYLRGLILSSAMTLGGAAEKAFLLLLDRYSEAISEPQRKARFKRDISESISIKRKLDIFNKEMPRLLTVLPRNLKDDINIELGGVFNLIRTTRNDAGHPSARKIEKRQAYANLQVFHGYCKRVYELIEFLGSHSV